MSTGQYPKRRETDQQAARRVERLERKRAERLAHARPLSDLEAALHGHRPIVRGRLV